MVLDVNVLGDTASAVLPFKIPGSILGLLFLLIFNLYVEVCMRRSKVNKKHSAKKFRRATTRTKAANVAPAPQRGGWRL